MQRLEEGLLYAAAIIVAVIWPAHSGDLINPGSDLDLTTFPARACMGWCRRTGALANGWSAKV
jgi:hypothetical protein